ncbi:type I-E CRISPR-associated protein Cas6/Cse3/CasE [Nitrosococcus wardiae]|uniref:Type I-E CRISPR-associated protein Cas6/Cse3/CasE n=1 Tax=Nitrosococcus wardiae TaxID=1814290 RepID=A0A4P7BXB9_9GAMM|nr:type I-E CRISPR-associated protein Cas6/Cse3/CasE [Nitrosococcus wardiae]QBQ53750.1 type I-E CRISPR-associated protein Cas6/Cse3/CasE [Nitrosococcus wardiae]
MLKDKLKKDGIPKKHWPQLPELIQSTGFNWLATRAKKLGFVVQESQVNVDGYRQYRLHKHRQSRPIRFSTLEFNGVLTVADPKRFQQTLYEGIGPAKGFGCGLLMVRRI